MTPIHINEFVIYKHHLFTHLAMEFPEPAPDEGQWIHIIGDSSLGSTALLRAMAMTLFPEPVPSTILGLSDTPWKGPAAAAAEIHLILRSREHFSVSLAREFMPNGRHREWVRETDIETPLKWPRLGFGAHADASASPRATEAMFRSPIWPLHSLLCGWHTFQWERWLKGMELEAYRHPEAMPVVTRIKEVVARFMGLSIAEVERNADWVQNPDKQTFWFDHGSRRLTAAQLPPRFQSAAEWICLLVGHLLCGKDTWDPDFNLNAVGIVLVDDILSHLSQGTPSTRLGALYKLFPRLTFVVVTPKTNMTLPGNIGSRWELYREGDKIGARTL